MDTGAPETPSLSVFAALKLSALPTLATDLHLPSCWDRVASSTTTAIQKSINVLGCGTVSTQKHNSRTCSSVPVLISQPDPLPSSVSYKSTSVFSITRHTFPPLTLPINPLCSEELTSPRIEVWPLPLAPGR